MKELTDSLFLIHKQNQLQKIGQEYDSLQTTYSVIAGDTIHPVDVMQSSYAWTIHQNQSSTANENNSLVFTKRNEPYSSMPFIISLLAIILYMLPKLLYKGAVIQVFQSIVSLNKFKLWLRDTDSLLTRTFLFTVPAYLLQFSLAADMVFQKISTETYEFELRTYLLTFIAVLTFFIIRFVFIRFASLIFLTKEKTSEYLSNIHICNSGMVLTIIPLTIFNTTSAEPLILFLLMSVVTFFEGLRIIRAIILASGFRTYNLFYFFLYFCTVEIIPLIIIFQWNVFVVYLD